LLAGVSSSAFRTKAVRSSSDKTARYYEEWVKERDAGCSHDHLIHNSLRRILLTSIVTPDLYDRDRGGHAQQVPTPPSKFLLVDPPFTRFAHAQAMVTSLHRVAGQ
jgi:hypothetical protein